MEFLSSAFSGEYLYSIGAILSFSAYILTSILWLRILLVVAAIFYIIAGISLGITSMSGWNFAYLLINAYHVVILLLNNSTVLLPEDTKEIYQHEFSSMTTREFKKLILMNPLTEVSNEKLIEEGTVPGKLLVLVKGEATGIQIWKKNSIFIAGRSDW